MVIHHAANEFVCDTRTPCILTNVCSFCFSLSHALYLYRPDRLLSVCRLFIYLLSVLPPPSPPPLLPPSHKVIPVDHLSTVKAVRGRRLMVKQKIAKFGEIIRGKGDERWAVQKGRGKYVVLCCTVLYCVVLCCTVVCDAWCVWQSCSLLQPPASSYSLLQQ